MQLTFVMLVKETGRLNCFYICDMTLNNLYTCINVIDACSRCLALEQEEGAITLNPTCKALIGSVAKQLS